MLASGRNDLLARPPFPPVKQSALASLPLAEVGEGSDAQPGEVKFEVGPEPEPDAKDMVWLFRGVLILGVIFIIYFTLKLFKQVKEQGKK